MTDTAPIRSDERFDTDAVTEFLVAAVPEMMAPITFAQFPGGKANLTYVARSADGHEVVLRRPPLGEVAPGAHDMRREFRVLSVLWQAYPKAPQGLALCDDESVMGKVFFVMERRRGTVVRETWPFPDEEPRRRAATSLIDALAELHQVDYAAVGLGDLGRPEGFVARQISGWTERWHRAKTRELADMDAALEALAQPPPPRAAVLLHNDFKLDNTMVSDDGSVTSVFDWDMSTLGDPLVDVGTALAYWSDSASPTFGIVGAAELAPYLSIDEAAKRYAAATSADLSDLDFYLGLAYVRIAVIVEQIFARYEAGQTKDERFAGLGGLVGPLAAAARRHLHAT